MKIDKNYNEILQKVLNEGVWYDDPNRKDVKRLEIPSYTFRHNFSYGFPAISTKKLAWKSVVTELIWFLRGDTNIKYLVDNDCNIWNKDAYNYYCKLCKINDIKPWTIGEFISLIRIDGSIEHGNLPNYRLGDLGKVYGHFWRNFNGVDQIAELISDMINKPMSSELLVVARDPSHKDNQALPCCHYGFQIVMRPLSPIEAANAGKINYDKLVPTIEHTGYGFELHWKQRSCDLFLGKIRELLK